MKKLTKLIQNERGELFLENGSRVPSFLPIDKLQTRVVRTSECLKEYMNRLCAEKSVLIPKFANAYYASEHNGATHHLRENPDTKQVCQFSVYAVQFGFSWEVCREQKEKE